MVDEVSRALPRQCYGNPADVVERAELKELGCKACDKHTWMLGRVVCTEPRVVNHKRVPFIGTNCKYFELKR
jgi:hypothetical protein